MIFIQKEITNQRLNYDIFDFRRGEKIVKNYECWHKK